MKQPETARRTHGRVGPHGRWAACRRLVPGGPDGPGGSSPVHPWARGAV